MKCLIALTLLISYLKVKSWFNLVWVSIMLVKRKHWGWGYSWWKTCGPEFEPSKPWENARHDGTFLQSQHWGGRQDLQDLGASQTKLLGNARSVRDPFSKEGG